MDQSTDPQWQPLSLDAIDDDVLPAPRPDRLVGAVNRPFAGRSLIGSFFLSGHERGWQGAIVAEPAPGVLLVETFEWLIGMSHDQQLVRLDDMVAEGWTFYDTSQWMVNAYDNGVGRRWEEQRPAEEEAA